MDMLSKQSVAMLGPPEAAITEEYKDIPMRDGFQSTIKIHKPSTPPAGGSPLIVFCFGGGFISGDKEAGTGFARAFVRLFSAVVVNISYRLAPQHKFPVSQYDGLDSVKWLAENASSISADPTKGFIVGGISAGGTLAAVISTEFQAEKLKYPLTGQWLCVPTLVSKEILPEKYQPYYLSPEHNKNAPILPTSALDAIGRHTSWDEKSPLRYPTLNKKVSLSSIPPTYLQSCGLDPLRDDALIYEEMLKEAGVKTKIDFYPGAPHAHFAFMPGIEITNRAVADIMIGMGWLLGKNVSAEQGLAVMVPAS